MHALRNLNGQSADLYALLRGIREEKKVPTAELAPVLANRELQKLLKEYAGRSAGDLEAGGFPACPEPKGVPWVPVERMISEPEKAAVKASLVPAA